MPTQCQHCHAPLEADARFCGICGTAVVDPNIGRVIAGRYALRERVGAGSLGIVYRAEREGPGRKVRTLAIKLLAADAKRDREIETRFLREGELLCKLRSPHTITTYEYDQDIDGSLYIAMELSPGRSLADIMRVEGALEWPRALRILAGLCDSLSEAHGLGAVHRDLKPENILVESRPGNSDFARVMDFGLAKALTANGRLSPPGETVGAVEYSSPEQLLQRPLDARSDLYALGVLGFQLVTGSYPFPNARSFGDLVEAQLRSVPPLASTVHAGIPPDVDMLLARCLEKDPARRFPDAAALGALIGVALAQLPPDIGQTIQTPDIGEEETVLADPPRKP
jgi:eukaryotic-like serine/threonine-protein kinase